jgi:hypothetical protein
MKTLKTLLSAACLAASLLFSPVKTFADKEIIFNQVYSVPMTDEYGKKSEENLRVKALLDADANTLSLLTYTQDYNRKNWIGTDKQKLPIPQRHTNINHGNSRIFVLRPSRVKVSEISQKAFLVPQYTWDSELEPYEEKESAQFSIEIADYLMDRVISKIPFLRKAFEKFIKNAKEEEEEYYEAIFEKINEEYIATRIPPYIPKNLMGYTETAREYILKFNTGNTQDEIPMFLWLKIALGDPSIAAHGSFPNKYGHLEDILIKFNLNENKVKREELYEYFFHKNELEYLDVANKNVEGTSSNPAIMTVKNMESQSERERYESDKVIRIGIGEYIVKVKEDRRPEGDLTLGVVQFETEEDLKEFMKTHSDRLRYPTFLKEGIMSFIEDPTIDTVLHIGKFNEQYMEVYFDLIINYMNRNQMQVILSKYPEYSEMLLKSIKKHYLNSEE